MANDRNKNEVDRNNEHGTQHADMQQGGGGGGGSVSDVVSLVQREIIKFMSFPFPNTSARTGKCPLKESNKSR